MGLGVGSGMFAVIAPVEKQNLIACSSYERGRLGASAALTGGVTDIGTTSAFQQFGALSMYVVPSAAPGTSGAYFGSWVSGNGTDYTVSAYVRGSVGVPYVMAAADFTTTTFIGSTLFTGGGTWQRYTLSYTETGDTVRRLVVGKASGNNAGTYYVDAIQAEIGSLTTYLDGDQEGCYWTGAPHNSFSIRSGQSRAGGSVIPLNELGFTANEYPGIGMPPIVNSSLSYALVDGAQFQRQRADARTFTLSASLSGTANEGALAGLHRVRQAFIDQVKIDAVSPQQPTRFLYVGGAGTVQIDAVYDGGLEFDLPAESGYLERLSARFIAYDPYWYAPTQQGTALAPRSVLGSANAIVKRDPYGRWGTMGVHGTSVAGTVDVLLMAPTGTLFVGGRITTFDGTANSRGLAMYYPSNNRFGTMGGTFTPGAVRNVAALSWSPWGSLYIGGQFTAMSGTATRFMAQWNGAFGSLLGGTVDERVLDLQMSATGTLFAGGVFLTANGTTTPRLAMWMPAGSWGTLVGQGAGTIDNVVTDLAFGLDQRLYFTGLFGSAGGTAMNAIGQWKNGTFGTMGQGLQWNIGGQEGDALTVGPDGVLTIGGLFGTAGVAVGTHVAQWNGVDYSIPGGGLGTTASNQIFRLAARPDGNIYATGVFSYNSKNIPFPDGMAVYNGYAWLPLDIDTAIKISTGGIANAIAFGPDNSIYIGGNWTGTANAAAVAEVVNKGKSDAYPTFTARNTGVGTARIYQLVNTLTNDGIYFNYVLLAGEEIVLKTQPGGRSLTSSVFGNIFGYILPGSNLARFRLQSGTNYISLFCDSGSVAASLYWTPRSSSADAGTLF